MPKPKWVSAAQTSSYYGLINFSTHCLKYNECLAKLTAVSINQLSSSSHKAPAPWFVCPCTAAYSWSTWHLPSDPPPHPSLLHGWNSALCRHAHFMGEVLGHCRYIPLPQSLSLFSERQSCVCTLCSEKESTCWWHKCIWLLGKNHIL